jgi:hypothetical protein
MRRGEKREGKHILPSTVYLGLPRILRLISIRSDAICLPARESRCWRCWFEVECDPDAWDFLIWAAIIGVKTNVITRPERGFQRTKSTIQLRVQSCIIQLAERNETNDLYDSRMKNYNNFSNVRHDSLIRENNPCVISADLARDGSELWIFSRLEVSEANENSLSQRNKFKLDLFKSRQRKNREGKSIKNIQNQHFSFPSNSSTTQLKIRLDVNGGDPSATCTNSVDVWFPIFGYETILLS